jgi:tetratricopeptide (TPR) repeat protein
MPSDAARSVLNGALCTAAVLSAMHASPSSLVFSELTNVSGTALAYSIMNAEAALGKRRPSRHLQEAIRKALSDALAEMRRQCLEEPSRDFALQRPKIEEIFDILEQAASQIFSHQSLLEAGTVLNGLSLDVAMSASSALDLFLVYFDDLEPTLIDRINSHLELSMRRCMAVRLSRDKGARDELEYLQVLATGHKVDVIDQKLDLLSANTGEILSRLSTPQVLLDAALRQLEEIPIDNVPSVGSLPAAFLVPLRPNDFFVGREDELLRGARRLRLGKPVAFTEPGGMGKTQIAVELAYRYGKFFPGGVLWIDAEDPTTVDAQLAKFGAPQFLDVAGWDSEDVAGSAHKVRNELSSQMPRIVILDNVADPGSPDMLLPEPGACRLVITSRYEPWPALGGTEAISVRETPRSLSRVILCAPRAQVLGVPVDAIVPEEDVDGICDDLGDMPLALSLAGAYLATFLSLTPGAYRRDLEDVRLEHPSLAGPDVPLPTKHATVLIDTLTLGLTRLTERQEATAIIIALLASMCAPHPIPRSLLWSCLGKESQDVAGDGMEEHALLSTRQLGLVTDELGGMVRMHRLVASALQTFLPPSDDLRKLFASGLAAQADILIERPDFLAMSDYIPHLLHAIGSNALPADDANLHLTAGKVLATYGDFTNAKLLFERSVEITEERLGRDHPTTAIALFSLAQLLRTTGDYDRALQLQERDLAISEETLGPDHPDTAASLGGLAELRLIAGDYERSRALYERGVDILERQLGPDDSRTAAMRANLALLLRTMGDYYGAIAIQERDLETTETALGSGHPELAGPLTNLASTLQLIGDYDRARSLLERSLAISETALGPEHPTTAVHLNNLSVLLQEMGLHEEALPHQARDLAISESTLGPDHLETAVSLGNMAALLQETGRYKEALPLQMRNLAINAKILGPEHPTTAIAMSNLARLISMMEDERQAQGLYEECLRLQEAAHGPDHPNVAIALQNLGSSLERTGNRERARNLYQRSLTISKSTLGPNHPSIEWIRLALERLTQ